MDVHGQYLSAKGYSYMSSYMVIRQDIMS